MIGSDYQFHASLMRRALMMEPVGTADPRGRSYARRVRCAEPQPCGWQGGWSL